MLLGVVIRNNTHTHTHTKQAGSIKSFLSNSWLNPDIELSLYPVKTYVFRVILESVCLSVCVSICVQNTSFFQSAGRGIKSNQSTSFKTRPHSKNLHMTKSIVAEIMISLLDTEKKRKKPLWEKEKMLVTSISAFLHNVFNRPLL